MRGRRVQEENKGTNDNKGNGAKENVKNRTLFSIDIFSKFLTTTIEEGKRQLYYTTCIQACCCSEPETTHTSY